jgi:hypothetical protein
MFSKMRIFAVAFLVGQVGFASFMAAQSLPATPHTPDLLGIYPGMPGPAARAQLQKHSSTINVLTLSQASTGFGMTIPQNRDMITVYLTQEPNDPFVWLIERSQTLDQANPMSKDALLAALRQKYGKETLTWDKGGGGLYLYWIFDQSGKLLATADERLKVCNGSSFVTYIGRGPENGSTDLATCYRSFFAVTAALNLLEDNSQLQGYNVELVNLPYAIAAATVSMNANNKAADQARRDQENKANQNKPTF